MTVLRVALVLGAAAIAAWFGLGWVQSRDTGRAQALLSTSRLTPGQARRVGSLLSTAGTLNPDRTVDILRAQLASDRHDYARAVAILESVTRAEPLNFLAWKALIAAAASAGDLPLVRHAYAYLIRMVAEPK